MSENPWIELSNNEAGLYQLAGEPVTNYNLLLYGKSLLARREGKIIFFIDNHNVIDVKKLKEDLNGDDKLLKGFFLFYPKSFLEFITLIDDLELQYFSTTEKPVIFISSIFEFLVNDPTNTKKLSLMMYGLGLLREFNIPVFVTNEMRSSIEFTLPFLSFLIPKFFSKVFIVEVEGKKSKILTYNY